MKSAPREGPREPSPRARACSTPSAPGSSGEPVSFGRKAGLYFQLRSKGLDVLCNLGDTRAVGQWAAQPRSALDLLSFSPLMDSFAGKESRHLGIWSDSKHSVFSFGSLKK